VRCGRCGNENAEANRFCGMCGASLVATPPVAPRFPAQPPSTVPPEEVTVPPRQPVVPVPAQPAPTPPVVRPESPAPAERLPARQSQSTTARSPAPVITGPSFLGLSTPGPHVERPAAEQDALRPSSNLDYLLDDEEEPERGRGKLVFVVVALALALGFGYLHWKQGGFAWLNADAKKPAAVQQTPEAAPSPGSGVASESATAGVVSPAVGTTDNPPAPAAGGAGASPEAGDGQAVPPTATSQAAPAQPIQTAPAQNAPAESQAPDPNLPAGTKPQIAGPDPNQQSTSAAAPTEPAAAVRKPSPARPAPAKPVDSVTDAERYIYGRGVRQDCDRGLHLLKPAAEQLNSKAMISLGALYSTGTCTPRDLPTAYRWFALALHKEPDNQALQDDLQKLWSQMTQPERQLAIKLSQ
jgi:hypothetical protein